MRLPQFFIGGYEPIRRPEFDVDAKLERQAEQARIAMGDAYLCATPVKRRTIEAIPAAFVIPAFVDEYPIG